MILQSSKLILPQIAREVLKDASESFKEHKELTPEILQSLYSIYNNVSMKALTLLDRYKFIQYKTTNGFRSVYKLIGRKRHFTLFDSINFCSCRRFEEEVLSTRNCLTCEHVLAVELAKIVGQIQLEVVSNGQLTQLLNNQICAVFKDF